MPRPTLRLTARTALTVLALALGASATAAAASPTATTRGAASVTQTQATLRASVNPHGAATTYAFQHGTSTAYGAQTTATAVGDSTAATAVTFRLKGLTPGVRYHYRVIATNADGTTTGGDRAFTTRLPPARPPSVLATAPFAPSANGLTFTAQLNPNGATTTYRFQYGTSTAYGLETFGRSVAAGVAALPVDFRINSLASRTTYHFRVVASNRAGTTYGPDTVARTGPFPLERLLASTRPGHASRSHPYFVTSGRLVLGSGVSVAQGCAGGRITVRLTSRHGTVARATRALAPGHCSYRLRMRALPRSAAVHHLRVHVTFGGNAILTPFRARTYLVGIGPARR